MNTYTLFNSNLLRQALVLLLGFSLILSNISIAFAQSGNDDTWQRLINSTSQEVEIKLKDGKKIKGRIKSGTDNEVSLVRKNDVETIERAKVKEVFRLESKKATKSTLIGAGAGFAAGAAIGAGVTQGGDITYMLTIPLFGGLGAGIGALVGFIDGKTKRKVSIYQAN